MLRTDDFDYSLPQERIAQQPLSRRDASRLLILQRDSGAASHRGFRDIVDYLERGDVLVLNDSRVIPARLFGEKFGTKGKAEILLLEQISGDVWRVLIGGKRLNAGVRIRLHGENNQATDIIAEIIAVAEGPIREVAFNRPVAEFLPGLGHAPLPPYIREELAEPERYQTVYARPEGSAAAPTAGLHFTPELLIAIRDKGVIIEKITLHVGLDTFKPVDAIDVKDHVIHSEWSTLSLESARRINEAVLAGGRIVAVGTTTARVLETSALRSAEINGTLAEMSWRDTQAEQVANCPWRPVSAYEGKTDLYIYPGYRFRVVEAMITNFHLPRSSLLMLVSAFAGRELILNAYQAAIKEGYRFYSFGDAMLIL